MVLFLRYVNSKNSNYFMLFGILQINMSITYPNQEIINIL